MTEAAVTEAPLLSVEKLSVFFKTVAGVRRAVDDVCLELRSGQTVALVGESGSGKSVTARAIMGMLAHNARVCETSRIVFDGEPLSEFSEHRMRKIRGNGISMVFQEPLTSLNPIFRVGEQVAEIIGMHRDTTRQARRREVRALFEEVLLPDPERTMRKYPHELSGGQRQRVMIAMALANRPKLLLADEPTTALDVTVEAEILHLLRALQDRHRMAMLFITHDLSVVRAMADRMCVMRDGAIVESGDTAAVMAAPEHPYTRHLLSSEPKGSAVPCAGESAVVLRAAGLRTTYDVPDRGLLRPKRRSFVAIDDVSLDVRRGECVGIVGESGSGKSTLGMALLRLGPHDRGTVAFDGRRIDHLSDRELRPLRSRLQVVFQDPFSSLNPRMVVRQILEEGLIVNGIGRSARERLTRIEAALDDVALPRDTLGRFPHEFSGGQRQRIAIARAIVLDPDVILLDEPTSALDLSVQAQVIELLRDLQARKRLSYLFISHDLKVIRAMCHRVLVLKSGRVVEQGEVADVLDRPRHAYTRQLIAAAFEQAVPAK